MNKPAIHTSDIRAFRQCRRRWNWSSSLRENYEPVVPYLPFFTGKAIHAALEFFYRDRASFVSTLETYFAKEEENLKQLEGLFPQEAEALQEQIDLIWVLLDHYELWQHQDTTKYSDGNLEFIDMEVNFSVPLFDDTPYEGRMDGLVKHVPSGDYFIWEAKTARSVQELIKTLANDEQCSGYIWAARQVLDVPIKGMLYNVIRKKAPSSPKVLKSGAVSTATNIDTSSYFFKDAVGQIHGWDEDAIVAEYGWFIEELKQKDSRFFMRYPVYRSESELDMLVENFVATAKEMLNKDTPMYPSPSWSTCNFCNFRSPCLTMNAGGDYKALLDGEFQKRQHSTSMRSTPNGE